MVNFLLSGGIIMNTCRLTVLYINNTKEIGLSRKTLYNNKVIRNYIEKSILEQKYYINNDKLIDL